MRSSTLGCSCVLFFFFFLPCFSESYAKCRPWACHVYTSDRALRAAIDVVFHACAVSYIASISWSNDASYPTLSSMYHAGAAETICDPASSTWTTRTSSTAKDSRPSLRWTLMCVCVFAVSACFFVLVSFLLRVICMPEQAAEQFLSSSHTALFRLLQTYSVTCPYVAFVRSVAYFCG